MKNLLVVTIRGDFPDHHEERIRIVLRKNEGGGYSWWEEATGASCELTAPTLDEAKKMAFSTWGSPEWDIRAGWIKTRWIEEGTRIRAHSSSAEVSEDTDYQQIRELIQRLKSRISLRNRQIRDLRRALRK